jgi:hypothetical protein
MTGNAGTGTIVQFFAFAKDFFFGQTKQMSGDGKKEDKYKWFTPEGHN